MRGNGQGKGPKGKGVRGQDKKGNDIMWDFEDKINFSVFPSLQGGPHNHTIGGLAVALKACTTPEFKAYAKQVKANAASLCAYLIEKGYKLATNGTENHLKTGGEQITYANKATAGSVDPRCKEVFTQLKIRRKHRYVVYKIDPETEAVVVETIGARDADLDALLRALPDADSRYAIFDHAYKTYDGRPANKLFFLSWFPSNATPYSKMAYTHAKEHVREVFTGVFDIMARTTDEAKSLVTGEAESESDQEFDDDDF